MAAETETNNTNKNTQTAMNRVKRQLVVEMTALRKTFSFDPKNSDIRKFLIFVLVITWASITIGIAFEQASVTPTYSMLTALIWALIGRIWGGNAASLSKANKPNQ